MASDPTVDSEKQAQADMQARDLSGKFAKLDPPLVSFSVTNPITYIKRWWKGVMAGEGVDIKLKIHPITAVMIVLGIGGISFGIGRFSVPAPIVQYFPIFATPSPTPVVTPNPWAAAAFVGRLQKQGGQFFLISTDARAILLEVPKTVDLTKYVGKRILASGKFRSDLMVLQIAGASNLEVITASQPVASNSSLLQE